MHIYQKSKLTQEEKNYLNFPAKTISEYIKLNKIKSKYVLINSNKFWELDFGDTEDERTYMVNWILKWCKDRPSGGLLTYEDFCSKLIEYKNNSKLEKESKDKFRNVLIELRKNQKIKEETKHKFRKVLNEMKEKRKLKEEILKYLKQNLKNELSSSDFEIIN